VSATVGDGSGVGGGGGGANSSKLVRVAASPGTVKRTRRTKLLTAAKRALARHKKVQARLTISGGGAVVKRVVRLTS